VGESLTNYKIGHEKKLLFLNRERVVGVQSANANQNFAASPLTYAGIGVDTVKYVPRGEQTNSFSINSYLVNKDYFLEAATGNSLYNIYLTTDKNDFTKYYSILSGYCNSFQTSYSVGAVAETSANFVAIGDAGKVPTGSMSSVQIADLTYINSNSFDVTGLLIPDVGSIELNIDTFSTNRLLSYTIRVESNKIPFYAMGSRTPKRVDNIYPINVSCDFTFEQGSYQDTRLRNFPQSGIVKNLSVIVKDHKTAETICSYSFQNLNLVSESTEISVNESVTVNQSYQGRILG